MKGKNRHRPVLGHSANHAIPPQQLNRLVVEGLMHQAKKASMVREFSEAMALLAEVLRLQPGNLDALLNLAILHGRNHGYERAETYLARALQTAPHDAEVHRLVAGAFSIIERPERAVEFLRSSLNHGGNIATRLNNLVDLAGHLERCNELDEASSAAEQALRLAPDHLGAQILSAVIAGRRSDDATAESRLRRLLANSTCPDHLRVRACYELAQLLDRQGDYDQAYRTLVLAKDVMRKDVAGLMRVSYDSRSRWDQMRHTLDATSYARFATREGEGTPYRCAILTGHPRTGTTLLEQVLGSHHKLVGADEFDILRSSFLPPVLDGFPTTAPVASILEQISPQVRQTARTRYWQAHAGQAPPAHRRSVAAGQGPHGHRDPAGDQLGVARDENVNRPAGSARHPAQLLHGHCQLTADRGQQKLAVP